MRLLDRMESEHPWLKVPACDYEGHMGPEGAGQLAPLSRAFSQVYAMTRPERLLVLGCATGNGLEHVDGRVTRRVVGVDVQPEYLEVARARHRALDLELICSRAEQCAFEPATFDLVFGALFFEWVDPGPMVRAIASWLAPSGYLCAVVQVASAAQPKVSATRYASVQCLKDAMHLLAPGVMQELAAGEGLRALRSWAIPVPHGKVLQGMLFRREA